MSAPQERAPLRPLELRRGTKVVTEVLAGRWIAVPADDPAGAELRRRALAERRYRWQLDVSGP